MPDSAEVASLRPLIQRYLREGFGAYYTDEDGDYVVPYERVRVHVVPRDWQEVPDLRTGEPRRYTVVLVCAWINRGMRVDAALAEFIATENRNLLFGRLSLDPERPAVRLDNNLLGDYLNFEELVVSVACVAKEAEHYGEVISASFGGSRP
ncbi:MAG: hypothetical protein JXA87_04290 [Thermoleophilia bacterium]|nr:hypothetical protein [Thermoleophilia bacterium]